MRNARYLGFLALCVGCGSRIIGSMSNGVGGSDSGTMSPAGGAGSEAGTLSGGGGTPAAASSGGTSAIAGQGGATGGASGGHSVAGAPPASAAGSGADGGAAGDGAQSEPAKALMLVDQRLYQLLSAKLEGYRALAEQRRGFPIELRAVTGLDDLGFLAVKSLIVQARAANPALEGVLFIGNVALPSFYKPRYDNLQTRLYPYFYEDLDATWIRGQDPGTFDPKCVELSPQPQQNCNVIGDAIVPPHDFDRFEPGPMVGPELWSAYWPVGVSGGANDYPAFAAQLSPYLDKLLAFYSGQIQSNGRYYFVSNDPGWSKLELLWNATPLSKIDFYGKVGLGGEVGSSCIVNGQNLCYVRWPLESYPSFAAFKRAYEALPFLGEGWQEPSIYIAHMNAALYEMVEVDVPSNYSFSIANTQETNALAKAGLIVALSGSNVTSFAQPRAGGSVDIPDVLPSDAVGVGYLYGKSRALAVLGDPTIRGHYANFPVVYAGLKTGSAGYLGAAHLAQMQQNYADASYEDCLARAGTDCASTLWENASEMLLGDPFMDLK